MKKIHKRIIGILFIIAITVLMTIPIGSKGIDDTYILGFRGDYIIHFLIYTPWMFLGWLIFAKRVRCFLWMVLGLIAVVCLEYIQMILPYRGFNINDLVAGVFGVIFSYIISLAISKYKHKIWGYSREKRD